jgi:hypothetical protein
MCDVVPQDLGQWCLSKPRHPGFYVALRRGGTDDLAARGPEIAVVTAYDGEDTTHRLTEAEFLRIQEAVPVFPHSCAWLVRFEGEEEIPLDIVRPDTFWLRLPNVDFGKVVTLTIFDLRDPTRTNAEDLTLADFKPGLFDKVRMADLVVFRGWGEWITLKRRGMAAWEPQECL